MNLKQNALKPKELMEYNHEIGRLKSTTGQHKPNVKGQAMRSQGYKRRQRDIGEALARMLLR